MLMTMLKGELATRQSKTLFKNIIDYVLDNEKLILK